MTGNFIEPAALADWAWAHGFRMNGTGTVHSLYRSYANVYGSAYGFRFAGTASSLSSIRDFLAGNGTAIISTDHHLMCVADYDSKKRRTCCWIRLRLHTEALIRPGTGIFQMLTLPEVFPSMQFSCLKLFPMKLKSFPAML